MKRFLGIMMMASLLCGQNALGALPLEFTFHKLASAKPGPTLLVVGGIQGDEPGGFNAASLLVTGYRLQKGTIWVVPNLNFISIIKRSRGVYGDLNRKFATLGKNDPEYETIRRIKELIVDPRVDLVLNLHDGSGFYREKYVDKLHGPHRWGQCVIVDQEKIDNKNYGELSRMGERAVAAVNRHLVSSEHRYRLRNTKTGEGNAEMAKTLTYFAIRNRKPAFGVEASKAFQTPERTYYHLRIVESFMHQLGIEFTREFDLTVAGISSAIAGNAKLALNGSRILLDVKNARRALNYIPLEKDAGIEFRVSSPLLTIVDAGRGYKVYHGNRRLTHLFPQYFEYDASIDAITMEIDGAEKDVNFGKIVSVRRSFKVVPKAGYRANVIGFTRKGEADEAGVRISRGDFKPRFSVDREGLLYRVEIYRDDKFSGMVLVDFSSDPRKTPSWGDGQLSLAGGAGHDASVLWTQENGSAAAVGAGRQSGR